MTGKNLPNAVEIIDSLSDGLYVTDLERRIGNWNKPAERITDWNSEGVLGHRCMDNILLIHEDKDGRSLCFTDYCPLHRCMVTGRSGTSPVIVFAQAKTGEPLDRLC